MLTFIFFKYCDSEDDELETAVVHTDISMIQSHFISLRILMMVCIVNKD